MVATSDRLDRYAAAFVVVAVVVARPSLLPTSLGLSCDLVTFQPRPSRKSMSSSEIVLSFWMKLSAPHMEQQENVRSSSRDARGSRSMRCDGRVGMHSLPMLNLGSMRPCRLSLV